MELERLFQTINGARYVYFDDKMKRLCTWDGDHRIRLFDTDGRQVETMRIDEPVSDYCFVHRIMLEHLEGVDRKE